MTSDSEFNAIRPYEGDEILQAAERVAKSDAFLETFSAITKISKESLKSYFCGIRDRHEFQTRVWGPIIDNALKASSEGVTCSGLEALDKNSSYIFISNHRDIILDSAVLNLILQNEGLHMCRSAIGDNLLVNEWVSDMMRLSSCFIVERNVPGRAMLQSSMLRSKYMRETVVEREDSIWIAEREGRTKNGDDRSQPALLKMLKMSGSSDFVANFKELNIVITSVSYEWEPCDTLKIQENYLKKYAEYKKTKELDMLAMMNGMNAPKGHIHYSFSPITEQELREIAESEPNNGERIITFANLIDNKIHHSYKLWPNNYVAYDILNSTDVHANKYSQAEKERFIENMNYKLGKLHGDEQELKTMFLELYANPIKNAEK